MDHGLQHLRGGDDRFSPPVGPAHDVLLHDRDSFDGHFHAQIAARDHDAVRRVENLVEPLQRARTLDLRDEKRFVAQLACRRAHGLHVRGAFNKGLADRVHAMLQREFQTLAIPLRERADAEIDAREVQSFARAQFATHDDHAHHFTAAHFRHLELDVAVVE